MAHSFGASTAMGSGSANPMLYSVAVAEGDTVLVVFVNVQSATLRTGGAPTYSGRTMTQAGSTQQAATSPETSTEQWYLLQPPTGTANVSIPNSGSLTMRPVAATGRSSTGATEFNASGGSNNTSTNPTASVTPTKDGCILFSNVSSGADTWAPSAQDGTSIQTQDVGLVGYSSQYLLQAIAGTQAMGWTFGTSDDWALCVGAYAMAKGPMKLNNYQFVSAGDGMSTGEKIR